MNQQRQHHARPSALITLVFHWMCVYLALVLSIDPKPDRARPVASPRRRRWRRSPRRWRIATDPT